MFAICIVLPIFALTILTLGYILLYVPNLRYAAVSVVVLYIINSVLSKQLKKMMQPEYYKKYSTVQSYVVQIVYLILFIYMAVKL